MIVAFLLGVVVGVVGYIIVKIKSRPVPPEGMVFGGGFERPKLWINSCDLTGLDSKDMKNLQNGYLYKLKISSLEK